MAASNTIQLTLEVDDKGSAKVKQFSANLTDQIKKASESAVQSAGAVGQVETAYSKLQAGVAGFFTKMQSHWVAFTAATVAAGVAIGKALEFISLGGAAIKAEESFRAMADSANVNADRMLASMKKAADGLVDDSHLMQKASFAMAQDIDPDKIPQLFEAARIAARKTGVDVTSAIDGMIQGISTNMPRSLRQMGAITKEQMTLLSKAMADGATDINLADLVLANAAVSAAQLGKAQDNSAYAVDRLKVRYEELKETLGKGLLDQLQMLEGDFQMLGAGALVVYAGISKLMEGLNAITAWGAKKLGMNNVAQVAQDQAKLYSDAAAGAMKQAAGLANTGWKNITLTNSVDDVRTAAMKRNDIAFAEWKRKQVEASLSAGIEQAKTEKEQHTSSLEELKKWQAMKDTAGLEGYAKKLAELNKEYALVQQAENNEKSSLAVRLQNAQIYEAQKTGLIRTNALQIAEEDKKSLESRLADATKFYGSLEQMIQKNIEDQKRGVAELSALYKQMADAQKSSASLVGSLQQIGMSPTEKFQAQKSALYDQGMAAMRQSGQEQVRALEEYKQALASFGQTWSGGVTETSKNMLFGDQTSVIADGKAVIASVISDITAATDAQSRALASLAEEKQKEIEANKTWGDTLVQTAKEWAAEIDKLKGVIGELDAQIKAMEKTITIKGDDQVSIVVDTIARNLAALHDKTVYITTVQRTVSEGYSQSGASVGPPLTIADFNLPDFKPGADSSPAPYALGTGYVPKTGMYLLHRGEAVTPPASPVRQQASLQIGDINIIIPESAAPQRPEDWRAITREYIVPEVRKIGHA